jgi:hypothetical protein
MFGKNYLREGRRFLLEGSKTWFRTATSRRMLQELLAETEPPGQNP